MAGTEKDVVTTWRFQCGCEVDDSSPIGLNSRGTPLYKVNNSKCQQGHNQGE